MRRSAASVLLIALGLVAAGCGQAAGGTAAGRQEGEPAERGPSRTLYTVIRGEPVSLASKPLQTSGLSVAHAVRLFNAGLDTLDARENSRPYLAEALPQLHTDSWRVFPDGTMDTTYRLKPNLIWHDGAPLRSLDFAFAWRLYSTPELGAAGSRPVEAMLDVQAPDELTVVIRWRRPYPEAGVLATGFQALPSHLLERTYAQGPPDAVVNHPFWSTQYVGLGPYRLDRWEPGAVIEGVAFDGHVLGRPKVDRVVVRFVSDENVALTSLLSGAAHLATDRTIRFEQAQVLRREWGPGNRGVLILTPSQARYTLVQMRPELTTPPVLRDLRVRKALVHAVDRQALNDALFEGEGIVPETFIRPDVPYFREVERAITKYPYDLRRTDELMRQVGYQKGADGVYVSDSGQRMLFDLWGDAGSLYERDQAIVSEGWRRAGFETNASNFAVAQFRDGELRASFRGLYTTIGSGVTEDGMAFLSSASIPGAHSRWQGGNRGGWAHAEYDRLWEAFNTTLDREQRNQHMVGMMRVLSEELPAWMLYFNFGVTAHVAELRGPDPKAIDSAVNWNIHEWELN